MNMWGFVPKIFDELETRFADFLANLTNPEKEEFFLPFVVDDLIKNCGQKVDAYISDDKWYGVTYKDDTPTVRAALQKLMEEGYYDGI